MLSVSSDNQYLQELVQYDAIRREGCALFATS